MLKNPATNASKSDFNVFTEYLFKQIATGQKPLVNLRNGMIVPVSWFTDDGPEYEHFIYRNDETGAYFIWKNDGHSITSAAFDMMSTVDG